MTKLTPAGKSASGKTIYTYAVSVYRKDAKGVPVLIRTETRRGTRAPQVLHRPTPSGLLPPSPLPPSPLPPSPLPPSPPAPDVVSDACCPPPVVVVRKRRCLFGR